ncbi:MAG: hypothetical protein ACTHMU_24920, partial [Thermomicrobiales bacterium]
LFCGIPRTDYGVPVGYPVAGSPPAGAAGTLPFMLGEALRQDPAHGGPVLTIARPILPAWLGTVTLHGLRVGKARLDLTFTRTAGPEAPAAIAVTRQEGELDVRIHAPVSQCNRRDAMLASRRQEPPISRLASCGRQPRRGQARLKMRQTGEGDCTTRPVGVN